MTHRRSSADKRRQRLRLHAYEDDRCFQLAATQGQRDPFLVPTPDATPDQLAEKSVVWFFAIRDYEQAETVNRYPCIHLRIDAGDVLKDSRGYDIFQRLAT